MKTTLIILVVLAILSVVIYLFVSAILVRKSEQSKDNVSDDKTKDDSNDEGVVEGSMCLQEGVNYDKKRKELVKEEIKEDKEEEVHVPEHCKMEKYDGHMPNKYFFNIHKYTSSTGKKMYCVVCSAVINDENHRIIVKNSYYPYLGSYTITLMNRIKSMFEDDKMSVEEFRKLGSVNFTNVGEIVNSF